MKYTIEGFSQEGMIKIEMDTIDATILRWFIDFKDTGKMYSEIIDGDKYYWVKYSQIIKDLPILKIEKRALARRFMKLAEKKVLKHYTKKESGTFSMYTVGERYSSLVSSTLESHGGTLESHGGTLESHGSTSKVPQGSTLESHGVVLKNPTGWDSKVPTNNSSIKETPLPNNSSINNSSINNIIIAEQVKELWNKICKSYSQVIKLSETRKKNVNLRLKEGNDLIVLEKVFYKLEESMFCRGINELKWKASFDWIFANDTNIIKVLEGKYENDNSKLSVKEQKRLAEAEKWLENQKKKEELANVE